MKKTLVDVDQSVVAADLDLSTAKEIPEQYIVGRFIKLGMSAAWQFFCFLEK